MDKVTLGSTGIVVNKNGFGGLPIQRIGDSEAVALLRKAYQGGINFFDTARGYSDSEKKIGMALGGERSNICIATKTSAAAPDTFREQLETSLSMLGTGYIDIYQFHNPPKCPKPGDGSGLYEAMLEAKAEGKIRHIGITCHRFDIAREAAESGLYETIQYPLSYLSSPEELDFVKSCGGKNIGVIAMKALSGGLITDSTASYAFFAQFDHVIPIWGIQHESELDEFIACYNAPPSLDERAKRAIERDKAELSGEFCRGCGYCMPCPVNINISISARMSQLMKRSPESFYLMDEWKESMKRIGECINCGHCTDNCPYGLDAPKLMRDSWAEYKKLL